jgi:TatD DNase family protein
MIDAHCHLDLDDFANDREEVLQRARKSGITGFLVAGVGPQGWPAQMALSQIHSDIRITLGVHPWTSAAATDDQQKTMLDELVDTLNHSKSRSHMVGIGELGLDRSRRIPKDSLERQEKAFGFQLNLAIERNLPIVLHVVGAHGRALEILETHGVPSKGGMVHSFSGSPEVAKRYLGLGLHLSFAGAITRSEAKRLHLVAAEIPGDRLLVETDCPDQTPHPPGQGRNEPANLHRVVEALAAIRNESIESVAQVTEDNARRLFSWEVNQPWT